MRVQQRTSATGHTAARLITVLIGISLELDIAEALISPDSLSRSTGWSLPTEDAESVRVSQRWLGYGQRHLRSVRISFEPYGPTLPSAGTAYEIDRIIEEIGSVRASISASLAAHIESEAPAWVHILEPLRQRIAVLVAQVETMLPPALGQEFRHPFPLRVLFGLDRMRRATDRSCWAINCGGDDRYGEMRPAERAALRYTTSEIATLFDYVSMSVLDGIQDHTCTSPIRFRLGGVVGWWLLTAWEQMEHWRFGPDSTPPTLPVPHRPSDTHLHYAVKVFRSGFFACLDADRAVDGNGVADWPASCIQPERVGDQMTVKRITWYLGARAQLSECGDGGVVARPAVVEQFHQVHGTPDGAGCGDAQESMSPRWQMLTSMYRATI